MTIELVIQCLLGTIGALLTFFIHRATASLDGIKDEAKEIKDSVVDLNVKIAVVVERVDTHERRISRLEKV